MTHRTTFALDQPAIRRLKTLAARWEVSQSEVIRRALEQAERASPPEKPDPVAMLKAYHAKGGLDRSKAEKYLAEVYEDRKHWRGEE